MLYPWSFSSDEFRKNYLERIGAINIKSEYSAKVEKTLEDLAKHIEKNCDLDEILKIASDK